MKPWNEVTKDELKSIKGVCVDIDDTISTDGKLTSNAFQALWKLKEKGYFVVPVSGRPAGWCDHIARFWPVDAIVGENGAFSFFMKDGKRKRIETKNNFTSEQANEKLKALRNEIVSQFPGVQFASDQLYRERDLAIDFCEDVSPWEQNEVNRLVDLCKSFGAHAKVSSIHVNTWFGDFDKIKGFQELLNSELKLPKNLDAWIYIGDSPNDEPMFEAFDFSVGVANLLNFSKELKSKPTWITKSKSGDGFCEVVNQLV